MIKTDESANSGDALQYEESDWIFQRRLASHFGTYLLADCTDTYGKLIG